MLTSSVDTAITRPKSETRNPQNRLSKKPPQKNILKRTFLRTTPEQPQNKNPLRTNLVAAIDLNRRGGSGEPPLPKNPSEQRRKKTKTLNENNIKENHLSVYAD